MMPFNKKVSNSPNQLMELEIRNSGYLGFKDGGGVRAGGGYRDTQRGDSFLDMKPVKSF